MTRSKSTSKHTERCRAAALAAISRKSTDPTEEEIYGPGGLSEQQRLMREGWKEPERDGWQDVPADFMDRLEDEE